jgi:hypothetical protein
MLRRTVRILLVLIMLLAVAGVVLTFVLRSDWLGKHVLTSVSEHLGMEVAAQSFSLGWGGHATLGEVTVRMPLSDEVVFSADRIAVGLDAVPLLLGRPIRVRSVEIDHPVANLRERENGRWNVQDVWTRVRASIASGTGRGADLQPPQVAVRGATVRITKSDGTTQTVGPIEFDGRLQGQMLWDFDLRALPLAHLDGRLVPGDDWPHEAGFLIQRAGPLAGRVLEHPLTPIQIKGRWAGKVLQDRLTGTAQLDDLVVGRVALRGEIQVEATSDRVTVRPRHLTVSEPNLGGEAFLLTGGAAVVSREQIRLDHVAAKAGALDGEIDGQWNLDTRSGEFSGSWAAVLPTQSLQSYGTYRVFLKSPEVGRREAKASMTAQVQTPLGLWHVATDVQGAGADWRASQWRIEVSNLSWSGAERRVDMTGATARIGLRWPEIQLTSLEVPQAKRANAHARFDVHTRRWSAQIGIEQLHLEALGANGLDLRLAVDGDDRKAHLSEDRKSVV